jgi:hypothetical protein
MGTTEARPNHGRQKDHIALSKFAIDSTLLEETFTIEAYQNARQARGTHRERRFSLYSPHSEVIALYKPLSQDGLGYFRLRRIRKNFSSLEVDAGQGLIDLQGARTIRLGIDVVPVEKAEGYVAIFLNLKNHHVTQRMDGSRRD